MVLEPLTAIGAASSVLTLTTEAWKLGKATYKLYKDTHNVDETVKNLGSEVTALGDTCNFVHEQLEDVIRVPKSGSYSASGYDNDGRLWKCIHAEVEQCGSTLRDLRALVDSVKEEGPNFIAQAKRQLKLNKSKEEITSIRQRIGTHMASLQTILQVVNM